MLLRSILPGLKLTGYVSCIVCASILASGFTISTREIDSLTCSEKTPDSVITDLSKIKWDQVERLSPKGGELEASFKSGETVLISRKAYLPYAKEHHKIDQESQKIFTVLEIEPEYPGGEQAWLKYVKENLHLAVKTRLTGEVVVMVQFNVDVAGNIYNVKSRSGRSNTITEEAIRLVKESGKWNPGIQNFNVVNALVTQPITIKPSDEMII